MTAILNLSIFSSLQYSNAIELQTTINLPEMSEIYLCCHIQEVQEY